MKYFVASQSRIKSGVIFEKKIEEEELIFVRYENAIKAYAGLCPHQGAKLVNGIIEKDAIVCPLHHRTYACKNGYDRVNHTVLKSFQVIEEGDDVFVELPSLNDIPLTSSMCARTMNDLPQPKGKPILGNLAEFKAGNKPTVLEQWSKECGPLFKISLIGKKFVVSTDPDFNIQLYKSRPDKFRRFGKIDEVMSEMGITGVFNAEGEQWKTHRKLTAEALNTRNVQGFFVTIQDITSRLLNRWQQKIKDTKIVVDVQKEMMLYTVDITTKIAFGYETNSLEREDDHLQQHLEKIFPAINKRITSPIPFWRILKSKEDKSLDASLHALEKTIVEFIQKAREEILAHPEFKLQPQNFLQALLVEQEKTGAISDKEIYGNVFVLILAVEDTTSNSISWALFYLTQHPEVFLKLRAEADSVLAEHSVLPSGELLSALTYTEAVAMETLRIKPVTPTLFLESLEDQTINGLKLKKGVTVMMQSKVAQTSDVHFTEAEKFMPERWLAGTDMPLHNMDVFRTFGAGPRFCPGKNLALHEMKMALSMIVKNFDLTLAVPVDEVKERFAFTMFPENLMLRVTLRNQ
jgi:cytochrome P450/nitrite reductase/ring-hydroxylating ferredoxin subunit